MLDTTGGEASDDEDSRQSPRLALVLSAMKATQWCHLGSQVEDDSQDQRGAKQILHIYDTADCTGSLTMQQKSFSRRASS